MSLEIYQAIVDTASAVGSLVAVCLAYKAFDVSRNISDHEQDNERTRLTIDALNKLQDEVLSKIYCPELYEIKSDLQEKEYKTEVVEDSNYYVGYTNIVQNGVPGEELVTRSIKKENGKILDVVNISTVETKAPINRIVKTGSRTQFVIGNTGIWIWPTKSGYVITTYFGHDNGLGYYRYHSAIDIAGLGCNSPI